MLRAIALAASLAACPALASAAPVETQIEVAGEPGPLKGTLLQPGASAGGPVVLILAGSGPTDRNGDNPLGVKGAPYRLLADGLAAEGITTLRVDKRGLFGSAAAATNPNQVTVDILAADAHLWARRAREATGVNCVWLLGHSEGVLVALIAGQDPADICGLILVSGGGRPYGEVLRAQLRANPANAPVLPQALAALDRLEAGEHVDTTGMHPGLLPLFHPAVQDFLIAAFRYDPARLAAGWKGPLLVIQGEADIQVSVEDARRLAAAHPGARLVVLPGVNHILKAGTTDRAATKANYADPTLPLAPGVVEAIAGFLRR